MKKSMMWTSLLVMVCLGGLASTASYGYTYTYVDEHFATDPGWTDAVSGASTFGYNSTLQMIAKRGSEDNLSGRMYNDGGARYSKVFAPALDDTQDWYVSFNVPFTSPYDRYVVGSGYANGYIGLFETGVNNWNGGLHWEMLAYSWSDAAAAGGSPGFHWDFRGSLYNKDNGTQMVIRTELWHWDWPIASATTAEIQYTAATRELAWRWYAAGAPTPWETYTVPADYTFRPNEVGMGSSDGIPSMYLSAAMDDVLVQSNLSPTGTSSPTFSPGSGELELPTLVTISCTTPGATIYYTTNGDDPTTSSASIPAGNSILVSQSMTVKAKAWTSGGGLSSLAQAIYTVLHSYSNVWLGENFNTDPGWTDGVSGASTFGYNSTLKMIAKRGSDAAPEGLKGRIYGDGGNARYSKVFAGPLDDTQDFYASWTSTLTYPFDHYFAAGSYVTGYVGMFESDGGNGDSGIHFEVLCNIANGFAYTINVCCYSNADGSLYVIRPEDWNYRYDWTWNPAGYNQVTVAEIQYTAELRQLDYRWRAQGYGIQDWKTVYIPEGYTFRPNAIGIGNSDSIGAHYLSVAMDDVFVAANASQNTPAATPVIHPAGGAWSAPVSVSITCATPGSTIRYTTDGSIPDNTSTQYTVPFTVSAETTVKAKAWAAGYAASTTAIAPFTFPTSFNGPATIGRSTSIAVDGNVSEWATADWIELAKTYDGTPSDIAEAWYAAKWDNVSNKLYVAAKVRDTSHLFTNGYVGWDARDAVEICVHTTGSGNDGTYYISMDTAQQYAVGIRADNHTAVWSTFGSGADLVAGTGFTAAGQESGQWLYYEASITLYDYFGGLLSQPSVITTPALNMVIGLDVCAVGRNATAYTGMKSENLLPNKWGYYSSFGLHKLVMIPGDVNGDGHVNAVDLSIVLAAMDSSPASDASADLDGDGDVASGDLSIVLANME